MAVRCPECKKDFDVTLFEYGGSVTCTCGATVLLVHVEQPGDYLFARKQEENKIREITQLADRVSFLIVSTDYRQIDIEIEKQKLKEKIEALFPDKGHLYSLIYEPRFRRLEEQFREAEEH